MKELFLVIFYFLFPALVLFLERKFTIVHKIGTVVICYAVGLILGNSGILWDDVSNTQEMLWVFTIPFAIPLILFSMNVRSWIKVAGKTFLSLILGLVSVLIMVFLGFYLFHDKIPEMWKISGLLVGLYSGGTPNLAAINMALEVDPDIYILTHTYDLIIGAVLLLFLLTAGQRFFLIFMKPYKYGSGNVSIEDQEKQFDEYQSYSGFFEKKTIFQLLKALLVAVVIFGIAGGLSVFVNQDDTKWVIIILATTTLGIVASLIPSINQIKKSFQLGMYLIYVFCIVVASMANISVFTDINVPLLILILMATFGALLLHAALSALFKVDVDNMIIISVALSMSPPFVPVIAAALKNREIILAGLFIGIIGYASGNYLGIAVAYLIRWMF